MSVMIQYIDQKILFVLFLRGNLFEVSVEDEWRMIKVQKNQ